MKIALVHETIDPRRGGAETSVIQMAARLAEAGADISVVAADEAPLPTHPRLRLVTLRQKSALRVLRTRAFLRAARQWCADQQIDVIHAVTPIDDCQVYQPRGGTYQATIEQSLALASNPLSRGAKWIGRLFNARQQMLAKIERRILRGHDPPQVAAVSELVARQIRRLAPQFPPGRLHVIFNACDVERTTDWTAAEQARAREELNLPGGVPIILFVAHNFKLKGLGELLSAFAHQSLLESRAELAVVGRDRVEPFAGRARRLGVESRVRFRGPSRSIDTWFAAADALAHPTWYDPCSRVVLEALGHGLPVVTTRQNGAADIVRPEIGRVVDSPRDVGVLADAIRAVLNPAVRIAAVGASGAIRSQLSMRRHAAELLRLYSSIACERR